MTIDYLIKNGEYEQIDSEMLKLLKEVQELDEEHRAHIRHYSCIHKSRKVEEYYRIVDTKKARTATDWAFYKF